MEGNGVRQLRRWLLGLGAAALLLVLQVMNALAAVPSLDRPGGGAC